MKISEHLFFVDESGNLRIPSPVLQEMGLVPGDQVYVAYLTEDGTKNIAREFLVSPAAMDQINPEEKIQIPSQLLEQANITEEQDLQIVCLDRAIVICGETHFDVEELSQLLQNLQTIHTWSQPLIAPPAEVIRILREALGEGVEKHESTMPM